MKAIKKLRNRKIVGSLAAIAWMAMLLIYVPYVAEGSPCTLSGGLSGIVVRPPLGTPPLSDWSFSIASGPAMKEVNGVVQGTLTGTFSATGLGIDASAVTGTWTYNQKTEKILIMLYGNTFTVDIAILNLPPPGFTFSGTLSANGQRPAMLVKTGTETISCN